MALNFWKFSSCWCNSWKFCRKKAVFSLSVHRTWQNRGIGVEITSWSNSCIFSSWKYFFFLGCNFFHFIDIEREMDNVRCALIYESIYRIFFCLLLLNWFLSEFYSSKCNLKIKLLFRLSVVKLKRDFGIKRFIKGFLFHCMILKGFTTTMTFRRKI